MPLGRGNEKASMCYSIRNISWCNMVQIINLFRKVLYLLDLGLQENNKIENCMLVLDKIGVRSDEEILL